jgi:hypothetical protein
MRVLLIDQTAREFATMKLDEYRQPMTDPLPLADEEVLQRSSFNRIERYQFDVSYTRTLAEAVFFTYIYGDLRPDGIWR